MPTRKENLQCDVGQQSAASTAKHEVRLPAILQDNCEIVNRKNRTSLNT